MIPWIMLSVLATTSSKFVIVEDETSCLDADTMAQTLEPLRESAQAHGYAQIYVSVMASAQEEPSQVVVEAVPQRDDALSWRRAFAIGRVDCPHLAQLVERACASRLQTSANPLQHHIPIQAQAQAQAQTLALTNETASAAVTRAFPLHAEVVFENNVSNATFYGSTTRYEEQALWTALSLRPSLTWDDFQLSLRVDVGKPLYVHVQDVDSGDSMSPDAIQSAPWTFAVSDLMLVVSAPEFAREERTHIAVGYGLTLVAPLSQVSRAEGILGTVRTNLDVDWKWAGFGLSYNVYLERKLYLSSENQSEVGITRDMHTRLGGPENMGYGQYGVLHSTSPGYTTDNDLLDLLLSSVNRDSSSSIYNTFEISYQYQELIGCKTGLIVQNVFLDDVGLGPMGYGLGAAAATSGYMRISANIELLISPWQHLSFALGATLTQLHRGLFDSFMPANDQVYFLVIGRV